MAFTKGDVVQLKSGGPKMTVVEIVPGDPPTYHCVWFDSRNDQQAHFFEAAALTGNSHPGIADGHHIDTTA